MLLATKKPKYNLKQNQKGNKFNSKAESEAS